MASNENIYNTRFNQLCKNHLKYIMLKQYLPSQQNLSHHAVISFFYYAFHTLVILQNIAMQIYIIRKYILTNESMSYKRKLMKIAKILDKYFRK